MLEIFNGFTIPAGELPFLKTDFGWRLLALESALSNASSHGVHTCLTFASGLRQYSNGDDFSLSVELVVFMCVCISNKSVSSSGESNYYFIHDFLSLIVVK